MSKSNDRLKAALADVVASDRSHLGKLLQLVIAELNSQASRIEELEGQLAHLDERVEKLERE